MAMKTIRKSLALLVLLCGCASMNVSRTASSDIEAIMNADRKFAADSAVRGGAAWADAFEENSIKPGAGGKWVIGSKAIGEQMTGALSGNTTLSWHPVTAQISRGGNLGYTWGRWTRVRNGVTSEGDYMTVWEKQPDGSWKALFDTGDADPKK